MPSDPSSALLDIAEHIHLAREWTAGLTEASFAEDRRTFYAVKRCLEIISEAVRRLPQSTLDGWPTIAWQRIKAAGNVYRHRHDDVLEKDVWDTVHHHLQALAEVVAAERAMQGRS